MKLPRRQFLQMAASAFALPAVSRTARAQVYPARPVHILVGFPPGGITDIYARLVGQWLSQRLGQPFIVENRPGAGGTIAADTVVRATPDGYTLLLTTSTDAWDTVLYDALKFDFRRDIAPVASISTSMGVLVTTPTFPVRSLSELIDAARASPGKITVASAGIGSIPHLYWALLKSMTGIDMLHVPYRGAGPAITDVLAGQVQVVFTTTATSIQYIRAGRLRPLAVTAGMRSPLLPDVPTVGELVPGYEATSWAGLGAPRNTPVEIIARLNNEMNAALKDPDAQKQIEGLGDAPFATSPSEFARFIEGFTDKWAGIIRAADIKAE